MTKQSFILDDSHKHDHWPCWNSDNKDDGWVYRCWCGHEVDSNNPKDVKRVRVFGAAHNDYKHAVERWLIETGQAKDRGMINLQSSRIMTDRHRTMRTMSFSQRQCYGDLKTTKVVITTPKLNTNELTYILDKLIGTNHPTGQSAIDKLKAML